MSKMCNQLHELFNDLDRMYYPFDEKKIPLNGIYIIFEKGERAHKKDRIVHIGTHTGENKLRARLGEHYIKENKDRSILRKNIGRALLNEDGDPFLEMWNVNLTSRKARSEYAGKIDIHKLKETEAIVSDYIRENFSFVAFELEDKKERIELKSKIIATVSQCSNCAPTKDWFGYNSPIEKIKESGLWLVKYLNSDILLKEDMEKIEYILT